MSFKTVNAAQIRASFDSPTQWGEECESCNGEGFIYNGYGEFDPAIHTPIVCGCPNVAPALVRFMWIVGEEQLRHDVEKQACAAVGAFLFGATHPAKAPAPRVHVEATAVCKCETSPECLQVYFVDRFNENREMETMDDLGNVTPAQPERFVPAMVRLVAATVEQNCPATLHYTHVTLDEWYGMDVTTQDDEEKRARLSDQDEAAQIVHSTIDAARPRWEAEVDSYESQHAFIERLTQERRAMLIRLLHAMGADPSAPETIAWVNAAIEVKHGNRLRGYARCIAQLRGRIERGDVKIAA